MGARECERESCCAGASEGTIQAVNKERNGEKGAVVMRGGCAGGAVYSGRGLDQRDVMALRNRAFAFGSL